jgi:hypothetical protein
VKRFGLLGPVHFVGNALALWLGYYWLGIGEARTSQLLWSLVVGLAAIGFFSWIHGAGFVYFRDPDAGAMPALRTARKHVLALLGASLVVLFLYWLVDRGQDWSATPAFQFASFLTLKLRKPVKPASMATAFGVGWWIVRWVILPVLILPAASATAARGFRGFGSIGPIRGYRLTWIETPLLLVCALWAPLKLLGWRPVTSGFGPEMFSFLVRLALAYLFFVAGCLALEFSASGGSLRWRQSSAPEPTAPAGEAASASLS